MVFAADLEPGLRASGWAREDEESAFREGAWWFERRTEGRLQLLRLWSRDHGPVLDIEVVFAGPDIEGEAPRRGRTRAVREVSGDPGLQLRQRIAAPDPGSGRTANDDGPGAGARGAVAILGAGTGFEPVTFRL